MSRSSLALLLALSLLAPRQDPTPDNPFDVQTPAERVRVTIGAESVELALGERLVRPGKPDLLVELLPTRQFTLPSVLAFEYPREWAFAGLVGMPESADGWWNLVGDGLTLYLRRHGGDARVVLEEYVTNLELGSGRVREPAAISLGERKLEGFQVRYTSGSFHGAPSQERSQEVYAWSTGGHAFLLTLDRHLGEPSVLWIDLATFPDGTLGRPLTLPTPAASAGLTTLASAWRWLDG